MARKEVPGGTMFGLIPDEKPKVKKSKTDEPPRTNEKPGEKPARPGRTE